ncbi:uncharacterized protein LOC141496094 isoform X2 [Macrotis lagotis]|uniref:uncharacterized protein LOC141496094 isoform X2 n=1 Tax=Macrotis lagotis TaxID=92651 RepID=UPI003D68A0E6
MLEGNMATRWSQRRGQHSGRWSLFLLLVLLTLFGIAEALTLIEKPRDISSVLVKETKVISRMGENVTLYCRANFQLSSLNVFWYHINQHGLPTMIGNYSFQYGPKEEDITEFLKSSLLSISPGEVKLKLKNVKPQDSGMYKCVLKDNQHSVERYVILQVIDPKGTLKKNEDLVIYSLIGFISAGLVVWMISLVVLCKRGDLWCPRELGPGNMT